MATVLAGAHISQRIGPRVGQAQRVIQLAVTQQHWRAVPPRGIVQNLYYRWSKEFLEAGKKRLAGDTARAATSDEVKELRREASALKEVVAELTLENRLLKKSVIGVGEDDA